MTQEKGRKREALSVSNEERELPPLASRAGESKKKNSLLIFLPPAHASPGADVKVDRGKGVGLPGAATSRGDGSRRNASWRQRRGSRQRHHRHRFCCGANVALGCRCCFRRRPSRRAALHRRSRGPSSQRGRRAFPWREGQAREAREWVSGGRHFFLLNAPLFFLRTL